MQTNLRVARAKAKRIGVSIEPSSRKNKKLDVFKDGRKVASIGDLRYDDYNTHKDSKRRANYKARHEKYRHEKGSASYYATRYCGESRESLMGSHTGSILGFVQDFADFLQYL